MIKTIAISALALCTSVASAQVSATRAATQLEWRQDLDYLAQRLPEVHPDPFANISEEEWRGAVSDLRDEIISLSEGQTTFEICKLIAMLGDQNTTADVGIPMNLAPILPVKFTRLSDGIYIIAATGRHKSAIGKRVLSIGGVPIELLEERVSELVPWDNESTRRTVVTDYMHFPAALRVAVGLDMRAGILLEVEKDGEPVMRQLNSIPFGGTHQWNSWLATSDVPLPVAFQLAQAPYSSSLMPMDSAMFISYAEPASYEEYPFESFASDVLNDAGEHNATRVVIDLRFNAGRAPSVIDPLLNELQGRGYFERPGSVAVLIGRSTAGSGATDAQRLRELGAVIVGEPTGGNPFGFRGREDIVLPRSNMRIACSTEDRPPYDGDRPSSVEPDVLVPWSSKDMFGAKDPALEAALKYAPENPPGEG
ncbi:MAG: peptidase S41 [Phycisphaeraceae bacterium]|nr:MAG: peptidase S41 [Phycisphaeraceae bacterium]